ncbi:hypothetical protein ACH5RR_018553 [Cinchona calisaya]|uniref:Uncharacterized protein n=1 Tax=Cinchona calisaya TaxID=153742 RepID=A0ABD2ZMA3_9GENT
MLCRCLPQQNRFHTISQFTDKSDVLSLGVDLVELLTRQKPIFSGRSGDDSNLILASRFLTCMYQNLLHMILDPQLVDERNEEEVIAVAKLAKWCISLNGKLRPTMKEVTIQLENIKLSGGDLTIQAKISGSSYSAKEADIISDIRYTWAIGSDTFELTSNAYPQMYNTV